ncbi:MAG: hypothetical protein AAB669_00540 [Patescibacteria group bacterium]|mgnify:CR=1 FL=1
MNRRRIIIVVAVVILLGIIGFIIYSSSGTASLEIKLDPASEVTREVVATLGKEKDQTVHPLPSTIITRPGKQNITVWGLDSERLVKEVNLKNGEKTILIVSLRLQSSVDNSQEVPYLSLFPYQNGDYRLRAEVGDTAEGKQIVKIVATINYRFSSPDDPASVKAEHDFILDAIKTWLRSKKVPDTIPIEESGEVF